MSDIDHLFKIIVIGDSSVGKTNILTRFIRNQFNNESKPTIGVDFSAKTLEVGKKTVKVQVWDTAGQERLKAFSSAYYQGSHGAIVVYDITNRDTFENVRKWIKEISDHQDPKDMVVMLIGNKSDLEDSRSVNEEEGRYLSEEYDFFFMETSAKTNLGNEVQKAFNILVEEMISRNIDRKEPEGEKINRGSKIDMKEGENTKKKGCC